ncbi:lipopolysaccharide biosynthesis protein [Gelidibacter japonicus]|uniref:lipopolysaccharide biosynthesis protein n=1 Tax=Gelidibacter japonicus TaxID=1962232 RepID=UPI002020E6B1|nr:lipopolysaccharide biosynthesis protein [Gelidibacter japonicus]MCL8006646.1 lipopolysaccharide biosynthesis protein [Gelidibacter japonicus]
MNNKDSGLRSGLKWNSIAQLLNQASVFLTGFILMRLLTPEDFGLVAIVTVFLGFSQLFTTVGLSSSIINKKDITKHDFDNIFTFSFFMGLVMALILFLLSTRLALFFEDTRLEVLFKISALALFIAPLGAIPSAVLKRRLKFKALALINIFSTFIALFVAIIMAYYDYGYFSLIAQKVIYYGLNVILLFFASKYAPSFWFNFLNLKKHLAFGVPILGSNLVNYSIGNIDNFLIGKFLGANSLGYYGRAFALVTIPSTRIGMIINQTMFPVFSNMKNKNIDIKENVLKLYSIISYTVFLFALLYIVAARSLIQIISPDGEWDSIIPIIHALALVSIFKPIIGFYSSTIISLGLTKLSFKAELVGGVIIVIGFIIGINFDILYFSYIYGFTSLLYFVYYTIIFSKVLNFKKFTLFHVLKHKLLSFILIGVIIYFYLKLNFSSPIIELPISLIIVGLIWLLINFMLDKKTSYFLINAMKSIVKK